MPGGLINAQLKAKCPRCRKGDIFEFPLSRISRFSAMKDHCDHCGASFEPEPGFYFGAMFVSYAMTVALFITIGLFLYLSFRPSDNTYVIVIIASTIVFAPFSFRYSRVLWLYWFGGYRYDPNI